MAEPAILRDGGPNGVFLFPAIGADPDAYRPLVDLFPPGLSAYGLPELGDGSVPERAARYVAGIRNVRPRGPYVLAGWSFGGFLAWEVASLLQRDGEPVELVAAIDSSLLNEEGERLPMVSVARDFAWLLTLAGADGERRVVLPYRRLAGLAPAAQLDLVVETLAAQGFWSAEVAEKLDGGLREFFLATSLLRGYRPGPYRGTFLLFRATDQRIAVADARFRLSDPALGWQRYADPAPIVVPIPADHFTALADPSIIAEQLTARIGALV